MLGPQQRVFIDGRLDFYLYRGVFPDYLQITRLERDAPRLLEKYNIQACIMTHTLPLVAFLEASPEWKKAYEDELSIIFVRKASAP